MFIIPVIEKHKAQSMFISGKQSCRMCIRTHGLNSILLFFLPALSSKCVDKILELGQSCLGRPGLSS